MIAVANVARGMLLASVSVMAVSGEAWASSPAQEAAVRAQVDALANTGIASANMNNCEGAFKYTDQIVTLLKQNQMSITLTENHTAIEQEMQTKFVATLTAIRACQMRASASTSAPYIPPPVQRAPQPAPNYATPSTASSGAGQQPEAQYASTIDAIIRQDAAGWIMNKYNSGSVRNIRVTERNGKMVEIRADYTFNDGFNDNGVNRNQPGWVRWIFAVKPHALSTGIQ